MASTDVNPTTVIPEVYLSRLSDIQKLLLLYVGGRLVLDLNGERAMNALFQDYCEQWGIPQELTTQAWAHKGMVALIKGTIKETRRKIGAGEEMLVSYSATLGGLEGCTHSLLPKARYSRR